MGKWLKPWHIGTSLRVLSESYPMNTNMTGSLSIGRIIWKDIQRQLVYTEFGPSFLLRAFFKNAFSSEELGWHPWDQNPGGGMWGSCQWLGVRRWLNGNTFFNFRVAAANSEAQSLGVRAAYISWIVRGFRPPPPHTSYLGTKKYPSFTKDPVYREIRNAGAAPLCTFLLWTMDRFVCTFMTIYRS